MTNTPTTAKPPAGRPNTPQRDMDADKAREMIAKLFADKRALKEKVKKLRTAVQERDTLITTLRGHKSSLQGELEAEKATNANHVTTIGTRDQTILELTARAEKAEQLVDDLIAEINSGDGGEEIEDDLDLSLELKPGEESSKPSSPPPGDDE